MDVVLYTQTSIFIRSKPRKFTYYWQCVFGKWFKRTLHVWTSTSGENEQIVTVWTSKVSHPSLLLAGTAIFQSCDPNIDLNRPTLCITCPPDDREKLTVHIWLNLGTDPRGTALKNTAAWFLTQQFHSLMAILKTRGKHAPVGRTEHNWAPRHVDINSNRVRSSQQLYIKPRYEVQGYRRIEMIIRIQLTRSGNMGQPQMHRLTSSLSAPHVFLRTIWMSALYKWSNSCSLS